MSRFQEVRTRAEAGRVIRGMITETDNPGLALLEAGRELLDRTDLAAGGGFAPLPAGPAGESDNAGRGYAARLNRLKLKTKRGK